MGGRGKGSYSFTYKRRYCLISVVVELLAKFCLD